MQQILVMIRRNPGQPLVSIKFDKYESFMVE